MLFSVLLMKQHTSGYSCPLSFLHKTAIIPALSAWLYRKYLFYPNKERLSQRLVLLKKAKHRYSRFCVARGRWAPFLLPDCFCFKQNVLRIILFAVAIRPALNQKRSVHRD
jgi:hypothetical protein